MGQPLASWTDGAARAAIVEFNFNGDIPMLAFADGWTVVSIKDDWRVVFAGTAP